MKPGPELDVLVAEKVMRLKKYLEQLPDGSFRVRPYSTDISAAWEVVEDFVRLGHECSLSFNGRWSFWIQHKPRTDERGYASAPHAICLAALKAAGHE